MCLRSSHLASIKIAVWCLKQWRWICVLLVAILGVIPSMVSAGVRGKAMEMQRQSGGSYSYTATGYTNTTPTYYTTAAAPVYYTEALKYYTESTYYTTAAPVYYTEAPKYYAEPIYYTTTSWPNLLHRGAKILC
ncbi:hypothetical protein OUZ56_013247 [Daphnia magna]|uniref:Uncharacterized protein n=1 Tax=Daphnia magna TaxID=35525 RepID=A0ABQ9Z5A6_9CRUS|nr:hypothetical protein OUZ56_013247 [Daphnia magna]